MCLWLCLSSPQAASNAGGEAMQSCMTMESLSLSFLLHHGLRATLSPESRNERCNKTCSSQGKGFFSQRVRVKVTWYDSTATKADGVDQRVGKQRIFNSLTIT